MASANVLIIEDDRDLQSLYKDRFEAAKLTVNQIYDGLEADKILKAEQANHDMVIILDLMLPGMSGYDLLAQIKRDSKHAPVMVISAVAEGSDITGNLELGRVIYVAKGQVSITAIINKVQQFIEGQNQAQSSTEAESHFLPFSEEELNMLPVEARQLYNTTFENAQNVFDRSPAQAAEMARIAVERFYERSAEGRWLHK